MTPRKVGLAALLAFALSLVSSDVGAMPKNLSDNRSLAHTRAPICGVGDSSTGAHFELSISGSSAAIGSAMTKGQQYRIACTVATLCEFGSAAPTADTNSPFYMPAHAIDYFLVMDYGTVGSLSENDWIACIAEDGSSTGTCYLAATY